MGSVFTGDAMPQRIGLVFAMLVSSFLRLSFFSFHFSFVRCIDDLFSGWGDSYCNTRMFTTQNKRQKTKQT